MAVTGGRLIRFQAWQVQPTAARLVAALLMAVWQRGKQDALMLQLYRSSQYAPDQFPHMMAGSGIVCSMRRSGNVRDHAAMVSRTERTERTILA